MRIKDPETGLEFENIKEARDRFCATAGTCHTCSISICYNGKKMSCLDFCDAYPVEAVRRMWYTVIEEDPQDGAKKEEDKVEEKKFDLAEALGVKDSAVWRLTEPEIAIMEATGAKWVSLDGKEGNPSCNVSLWWEKPSLETDPVQGALFVGPEGCAAGTLPSALFPSIQPGDCISKGED